MFLRRIQLELIVLALMKNIILLIPSKNSPFYFETTHYSISALKTQLNRIETPEAQRDAKIFFGKLPIWMISYFSEDDKTRLVLAAERNKSWFKKKYDVTGIIATHLTKQLECLDENSDAILS